MIWRDSTTLIVPVGLREEVVDGPPKRLCTSSTAFDRSGPIWAGLFTPSAEIEWQTKQPVSTNQRAGSRLHAPPRPPVPPALRGSVRGAPAR